MTEFAIVIMKGIALGVGVAAPFGPINSEIVRRSLRGGFLPGFVMGMGAVATDVGFAALALYGFSFSLADYPALRETLRFVGGGLLLTLGTILLIQAYRHYRSRKSLNPSQLDLAIGDAMGTLPIDLRLVPGFFRGFIMTILNPITWGFWFVALPAMAGTILPGSNEREGFAYVPLMLMGVLAGAMGWVAFISGVAAWVKQFSNNLWIVIADVVGAIMLLGFGFLVIAYQPGV